MVRKKSASRVRNPLLEDLIEEERSRLMKADAILHCVLVAMEDDGGDATHAPHYPSIVELARDLVNQSINQLDSVQIGPTMHQPPAMHKHKNDAPIEYSQEPGPDGKKNHEVKESPPSKYMH